MSAGQTVIVYNGITITNCVTEQFAQEAVFDDSGTDLLFHKFTIEVSGFISGLVATSSGLNNSVVGVASVITPTDPAYQEVAIRAALLEPRQEFVMRVGAAVTSLNTQGGGGTVLLRALPYPQAIGPTPLPEWKLASPNSPPHPPNNTPAPNQVLADRSGYDLNNGPKCLSCTLTRITGNTVFRVQVKFEVCKLECDIHGQAKNNKSGVLSNRWSVADDIDENFMTTRRFQGVLRVMTANLNAHEFRKVVVPPLQAGFHRKSMSFQASEDGLKLAYTVIDREVVWSAPRPATKWYLNHKETSSGADGVTTGEATCQLWGDRNTADQRDLIKTAIAIVMSKLYFIGGANAKLPEEFTCTTEYGTDSHSVTAYLRLSRVLEVHNVLAMAHDGLGAGISAGDPHIAASPAAGYNPTLSRGSRPGDHVEVTGPISIATAWRAFLQSPCDEDHAIDLARNAQPQSTNYPQLEYTLSVVPASSIADTPAGYISDQHRKFPYTYWDMRSFYDSDQHSVALPIARSSQYLPQKATQVVVSLSPPTWKRRIQCSGTRVGKEPDMPKFPKSYAIPSGGTESMAVLIGREKISVEPPTKTIDGQNIYRVAVEVEYALSHEPGPSDTLPVGFLPWQNNSIGYKFPLATSFSVTPFKAGIS